MELSDIAAGQVVSYRTEVAGAAAGRREQMYIDSIGDDGTLSAILLGKNLEPAKREVTFQPGVQGTDGISYALESIDAAEVPREEITSLLEKGQDAMMLTSRHPYRKQ